MKKFSIKANLLEGIINTVGTLSVEAKATVSDGDAVENVRMVDNTVADLIVANKSFHDEVSRVGDEKQAVMKKYQDEFGEKKDDLSPDEVVKLSSELTQKATKEMDAIQETSKAEPESVVEVEVGDDKHAVLSKCMRLVFKSWNDSKLYVEAADAVDNAEEV